METPRKYPSRLRTKVSTYFENVDISMEEKENPRKRFHTVEHSVEDNDKSTDSTNETSVDDDLEEEVSEYEKMRLRNLEENRRIMLELGLIDIEKEKKLKLESTRPKIKASKPRVRAPKPKTVLPTKRSLRLLQKTPDGKNISEVFQETPVESPIITEEKTRIEEEVLPMNETGESIDFLDTLKAFLSQNSGTSSVKSTNSLIDDMRNLEFAAIQKVTNSRVQSVCIHPLESKLLVIVGSVHGELGLWNVSEDEVAQFKPHLRPINCVSVSEADHSKLFTTGFDGTVRRADINKSVFDLVYETDEKRNMCHLTWHSQIDANTLMVAHGTGEAGIVDLRAKNAQQWFHCHPRSIRTTHLHPNQPYYFITASGIGECKIWDLRGSKKHVDECVGELTAAKPGKGLTSAFFSPNGNNVVTTCNDDFIRIFDSSDLANPKELRRMMHDNHTGRWLSVFKAVWHPHSSDLIFVGSMLQPRRIQLYSASSGRLVRELMDDMMTTVTPVLALHPTLPTVVGGNSSGKAHIFTTPLICNSYVKKYTGEDY